MRGSESISIIARLLLLAAVSLLLPFGAAQASDRMPRTDESGWSQFIEGLRVLPDQLATRLPAAQRADPQVRQDIERIVLASLAASLVEALGSDVEHPAFVANQNLTFNFPQPNADTVYRVARIAPGGTYRLRGERGTLRMSNIGQAGPMPGEPGGTTLGAGPSRKVFDLNSLQIDNRGQFDVVLSPKRPAGHVGDWWELAPDTTRLVLRTVAADPGTERDPTVSIERLDIPTRRLRSAAAELEELLLDLPRATALLPSVFVTAGQRLRAEGFVHRFKLVDASANGGLAGQSYYSSVFELEDDEALVVSVRPPDYCRYRSIQLASESMQTLDWQNNQSSLNDVQAKPDSDGILRIVVAGRDPGVPNWLDTAEHRTGIVEGRWMDCHSTPVPVIEKIKFADLSGHLPADTPAVTADEREQAIRDRRAALQQRPLW